MVLVALLTPLCLQLTQSWIFKISDDVIFSLILVDALIAVKKKGIKTTYDLTCIVMMSLLLYLFWQARSLPSPVTTSPW
jgi:hypothetical protein